MIVGAENWFLCSGNLCSITSTVGIDNRPIEMILDDMEKAGKIVRIKEFSIVYPTWDYAHENPEFILVH